MASRAPAELQQQLQQAQHAQHAQHAQQAQLQQAQQQNQTLARVLAERCEQAACHVEQQQQLSDMWQQLVSMHAVPAGATVQVQSHPPRCPIIFQNKIFFVIHEVTHFTVQAMLPN